MKEINPNEKFEIIEQALHEAVGGGRPPINICSISCSIFSINVCDINICSANSN